VRWLIVVAACSGPAATAPPVVSNARVEPPAAAKIVTCGSSSVARCFSSTAACEAELQNCRDAPAPHWMCSRMTSTGMVHGTIDLCFPSAELCTADPQLPEIQHEPCRPVPEVYCRGTADLNCHPTRAICEQEVKTLVSFGGEPSACVRY
jgi:hypothetical protein